MSDDTKTNIHDLIKKDIEPAANALIKEQKDGIGKLAKIMVDLGKAIDKPDARMVKLLSKALDAESPLIANRLSRTGKLLERLEEAESETDLDNDLKELEDITTRLSELEKKLQNNYATIKEYRDELSRATSYWQRLQIKLKISREVNRQLKDLGSPYCLWLSHLR